MFWKNYLRLCRAAGKAPTTAAVEMGFSSAAAVKWMNGAVPRKSSLLIIANYFGVPVEELTAEEPPSSPVIEGSVKYPVIGEVAAGYDHIAFEDWAGDTVDIPMAFLKGRKYVDFFCLRVTGDSMFPQYQDGDIVFVLKQATMNRSGQIGVVSYGDDKATLKRVEYVTGEDWMKLSPVNPAYPPVTIRDEQLEHCRVLGIPKLLIREIED